MKKCTKCGEEKPATLEYFPGRKDSKDGFRNKCKICTNEYHRDYDKLNSYKYVAYRKKYEKENKNNIAIRKKKWRIANKTKIAEYKKNRRKTNPEPFRRSSRKRRALVRQNGYEFYTEAQVFETYGTNCTWCDMPIDFNAPRAASQPGWRSGLQFDHFISTSNGGPDTLENIRPTHGWCNNARRNNDVEVIK